MPCCSSLPYRLPQPPALTLRRHSRLSFDDLHSHGIYSWPFLHELGSHKLSRLRRYIRALRAQGLSRDPPRLRRAAQQRSGRQGAAPCGSGGGRGPSSDMPPGRRAP